MWITHSCVYIHASAAQQRGAQVPPMRRQEGRWGPPGVHAHPPLVRRHHGRPALRMHRCRKLLSMLLQPQLQMPVPFKASLALDVCASHCQDCQDYTHHIQEGIADKSDSMQMHITSHPTSDAVGFL